jgi:hypothetical protein
MGGVALSAVSGWEAPSEMGLPSASQMGARTVDMDSSAAGARERLFSKPVCIDLTVCARSGSSVVVVGDARDELVRTSRVLKVANRTIRVRHGATENGP